MLQQKLAALETGRQLFPHGLFDHPRSGEADQRFRLGDIDVAQHREAGGNAAGGRVGQHRQVGDAVLGQPGQRRAGFGHLHQRHQGLLHPRPAAGGEADERAVLVQGGLRGADEALAHHRAHGAGHEGKLEGNGDDWNALEPAAHGDQRVFFVMGFLRLRQPVAVFFAVFEFQKIGRFDALADFGGSILVEKTQQALAGSNRHVMAAFGTDLQVALQFGAVKHRAAFLALVPKSFGNLMLVAAVGANSRWDQFFVPTHNDIRRGKVIGSDVGRGARRNAAQSATAAGAPT